MPRAAEGVVAPPLVCRSMLRADPLASRPSCPWWLTLIDPRPVSTPLTFTALASPFPLATLSAPTSPVVSVRIAETA